MHTKYGKTTMACSKANKNSSSSQNNYNNRIDNNVNFRLNLNVFSSFGVDLNTLYDREKQKQTNISAMREQQREWEYILHKGGGRELERVLS